MSYNLVLHTGPDDARPKANPLVRILHPLLRRKKWKASINLRKSENYALKVRSWKSSQSLLKCPRSLHSLFACFLFFQTGKNRMQLNCRVKRYGVKIKTVARKSWIGGLNFRKGTWHSESLAKSLLICSVSYLNLEGLSSPMATVATGLVYISLLLSLLKYV